MTAGPTPLPCLINWRRRARKPQRNRRRRPREPMTRFSNFACVLLYFTRRTEAHRGWCPARTSNPLGAGGTRLRWVRFPHASASSSGSTHSEGGSMKKLVLLIVVLVGIWLGVNYVRTGQFSFLPTALSGEEQHVRDLEKQIAAINEQMAQAGRAAGMTRMDTTQDVSALMEKKTRLEKELEEARKKLH